MADNFDKFRPDWTVGTLTLTGGSTAFTATNAELILAAIREGDAIITPTGFFLPIETLAEDGLTGTLSNPAPAAAEGTFSTRIRYQSDNSRFTGALLALTRQLTGGNLQSFAGLSGAPDKGIMFTGPGTAGTFDLTDVARELLNDTSYAAMLTTLGAQASLGFTPANKTGDTFTGNVTIAPTGGNGQVRISIDGTNFNWFNQAQIALRNNTTGIYSYLNGNQVWLLRNGGMQIDLGDFSMTQGLINSIFNGTGTRIRWGQNAASLSALAVDANGAGQMALYGPAAISYFSGDGSNLLRGTSYAISRGNLSVSGSLSKGSGTFLIDHPLDPTNKNLRHGFVESTEYVNIYRGMVDLVNGRMTVDIDAAFGMMDGTFAALNADVMVSSLQNQYGPDRVWVEAPADSGKFTIVCEDAQSTATVAWMVTGRRKDAFVRSDLDKNTDNEGRFIPEFDKEDA